MGFSNKRLHNLLNSFDPVQRKHLLTMLATILISTFLGLALLSHATVMDQQTLQRSNDLQALMLGHQQYKEAVAANTRLKAKMQSLSPQDSALTVIQSAGLNPRLTVLTKPIAPIHHPQVIEEPTEVIIQDLTLNETVQLIYALENSSKAVVIRHIHLRSRFSNPSRIDLTMTVSLYRPEQAKPRP